MNAKYTIAIAMILALLVSGLVMAEPSTPISTSYEVFTGTANAVDAPHDFARNSFDWFICNHNSTFGNTLTVKINATTNAAIPVYGGQCVTIDTIQTGIVYVTEGTAEVEYHIVAFER